MRRGLWVAYWLVFIVVFVALTSAAYWTPEVIGEGSGWVTKLAVVNGASGGLSLLIILSLEWYMVLLAMLRKERQARIDAANQRAETAEAQLALALERIAELEAAQQKGVSSDGGPSAAV